MNKSPIFVKCLSGEIIVVNADSDAARKEEIARALKVNDLVNEVVLVEPEDEEEKEDEEKEDKEDKEKEDDDEKKEDKQNEPPFWLAMIQPRPRRLTLDWDRDMIGMPNIIRHCTNADLLTIYLQKHGLSPYIVANPHPLVVAHILAELSDKVLGWSRLWTNPSPVLWADERFRAGVEYRLNNCGGNGRNIYSNMGQILLENTNLDVVVEWILGFVELFQEHELVRVRHPRVVDYLTRTRPLDRLLNISAFVDNPACLGVCLQHVDMIPTCKHMWFASVCAASGDVQAISYVIDLLESRTFGHTKFVHSYLVANPHDRAVDYVLGNRELLEKMMHNREHRAAFSRNPSDRVVEMLVHPPDDLFRRLVLWPDFLCNTNPLALETQMEWVSNVYVIEGSGRNRGRKNKMVEFEKMAAVLSDIHHPEILHLLFRRFCEAGVNRDTIVSVASRIPDFTFEST